VKFPGVGKKTARQMILDLKGKLAEFFGEPLDSVEPHGLFSNDDSELEEAMLALVALGYSEREIAKVKPKLKDLDLDTEGYMKKALQLLLKFN
jgi:Holliday junction DNA helicase RuvA